MKIFPAFLLLAFVIGSCKPVGISIPIGWEGDETKWWKEGLDTTGLFRNLDTFEAMGIQEENVYYYEDLLDGTPPVLVNAIRIELMPLFRHDPQLMDSLFNSFAKPEILAETIETRTTPREKVIDLKKESYRLIRQHFREPSTKLVLGQNIKVPYPDSLRKNGVGGDVQSQVRLNAKGEPIAIELLNSVHPVLDKISMRATSEMRWWPAYLNREPIPAWVRFKVKFKVE